MSPRESTPPYRRALRLATAAAASAAAAHLSSAAAATLEVGPGHAFARIEDANAQAQPGDIILVHPRDDGSPYARVALFVTTPRLTFRAAPRPPATRVAISGADFDYSGVGRTPRAIVQFNAGADGCALEGFELCGAHNQSHNGAGVRINQANHIRVRDCDIHHNDMGIMSNGDGGLERALDQRIERSRIHHNGDPTHPGYNHNLYLGGASVTLSLCEIASSLTGHNVKSRAHHNRIEYCWIHDSANRELDLVDAAETGFPESDAVLIGNVIVKDPACPGNRGVIHFGQDGGGGHDGTLHMVHNTVVTPFIAPVLTLSAPGARSRWIGNLVDGGGTGASGQSLVQHTAGLALTEAATGSHNWLAPGFAESAGATGMDPATTFLDSAELVPARSWSLTPTPQP